MRRLTIGLIACAAIAYEQPVFAHHSFAQFDASKTLTLNGTVRNFEWTNPHAWLWILVPGPAGTTELWGAETKAPTGLARDGWTKRSFKPGDKIKLEIHPIRTGAKAGDFIRATFADGRQVAVGDPVSVGPPPNAGNGRHIAK
jgi:Family of unknown function (DUF6152)